jgi:hypothetical protein
LFLSRRASRRRSALFLVFIGINRPARSGGEMRSRPHCKKNPPTALPLKVRPMGSVLSRERALLRCKAGYGPGKPRENKAAFPEEETFKAAVRHSCGLGILRRKRESVRYGTYCRSEYGHAIRRVRKNRNPLRKL